MLNRSFKLWYKIECTSPSSAFPKLAHRSPIKTESRGGGGVCSRRINRMNFALVVFDPIARQPKLSVTMKNWPNHSTKADYRRSPPIIFPFFRRKFSNWPILHPVFTRSSIRRVMGQLFWIIVWIIIILKDRKTQRAHNFFYTLSLCRFNSLKFLLGLTSLRVNAKNVNHAKQKPFHNIPKCRIEYIYNLERTWNISNLHDRNRRRLSCRTSRPAPDWGRRETARNCAARCWWFGSPWGRPLPAPPVRCGYLGPAAAIWGVTSMCSI